MMSPTEDKNPTQVLNELLKSQFDTGNITEDIGADLLPSPGKNISGAPVAQKES